MKKMVLFHTVMAVVIAVSVGVPGVLAQVVNSTGATPILSVTADPVSSGRGNVSIGTIPGCDNTANPAKINFTKENTIVSTGYTQLFKQVPGSYLASLSLSQKFSYRDAVSVGLLYGCYGKEYFTDVTGNVTSVASPNDFSITVQYARMFSPSFSLAVGPHLTYSSRGNGESGSAVALDASAYYLGLDDNGSGFSAGLSIQDVGTPVSYTSAKSKGFLPATAGFGLSYTSSWDNSCQSFSIGADVVKSLISNASPDSVSVIQGVLHPNNDIRYGIGLQYRIISDSKNETSFALRTGYVAGTYLNANGFTFGVSGAIKGFGVNVSYLIPATATPVAQSLRFGFVCAFH